MTTQPKQKKKRGADLLFLTATISTTMVLFLIGIIAFLLLTTDRLSDNLREEMTVEIVLNNDISQSDVDKLINVLGAAPYTKECSYTSKDEALSEMSAEMGVDPTEFLQYNPFYASLSLKLRSEYANRDSLNVIVPKISSYRQVKELNYQRELLDAVNQNIAKVSIVLLILAALLTLISVTLINNIIKLSIYAQRFTLYSMKLVGAKWSFIRRPFLFKNLWIGITAAILASLLIWGGLKFGARYEPGITSLLNKEMMIPVFAIVLATGLVITWLCALRSVNRFLRMKSGELYYI